MDIKGIKGYRNLRPAEINLMDDIKILADKLSNLCDALALDPRTGELGIDQHWVAIGKTHLQQGIMALVRAVERPTTF